MDPQIKFQQIRQLKLTHNDLGEETFVIKEGVVELKLNGRMEFLDIKIPKTITPAIMKSLKKALNKSAKEVQKRIVQNIEKTIN